MKPKAAPFLSMLGGLALGLALVPGPDTFAAKDDWAKTVNVPRKGNLKPIPPSRLTYELSWRGHLKAGEIDVDFGAKNAKAPNHFVCRARGGSTGLARVLFPFSFDFTGYLHPVSLRPLLFVGTENDDGKIKRYENRFENSGVKAKRSTTEAGRKREESVKSFKQEPALDIFSAILQIRSLPLKNGSTTVMPFFPVSKPYLARVKVVGRERFDNRKAIKLRLKLLKIDKKGKLESYEKMKSATLWISDDEMRTPLEVRVDAMVGDVRMTLKKRKKL